MLSTFRATSLQSFVVTERMICLISGIIGARLFYVLLNPAEFAGHPLRIVNLSYPGLVFYGGIVFALPGGILFLRKNRLATGRVFDLVIPYVALGQSIGRIGCFLYGCCYGIPTSSIMGVYFPGRQEAIHPVQIYSSLVCLSIFLLLRYRQKRAQFTGAVFLEYLIYYSLARFLLEFLRGDTPALMLNMSLLQLMSLAILIICTAVLVILRKVKSGYHA